MTKSFRSGVLGFILGISLTFLLVFGSAFAVGGSSALEVVINNVNVMLDGQQVGTANTNYTLSNGDEVPFSIVYNGTTYLPIRKISELLGKEVGYIAETKTITLGDAGESKGPGWYLVEEGFTKEIDTFKEGTFTASEQYWEKDAAYTSMIEGNVAFWSKYYVIDKSTGVRKAPESEDSASFTWSGPADFIPVDGQAEITASMNATDDFGASINATIHSFHQLSPAGDGESHYIKVGDSATTLRSMPLEKQTFPKPITISLKLNALSQQTVYEYTYEYKE
jgi:hypothetical protein